MFNFKIQKQSKKSQARIGIIKTNHGIIHTPSFVPVATQGAIKGAVEPQDLKEIGIEVIFANTYHLFLRPGPEIIKDQGGLHKFMNFDGVIMTDSGGFQAFSLGWGIVHNVGKIANIFPDEAVKTNFNNKTNQKLATITDDGVKFRSHIDGKEIFLTPEKSIEIQQKLGADIILAFDECTSPLHNKKYTASALKRTHLWALRSLKAKTNKKQAIYGIVQGGVYQDLRQKSAKFINSLDFDGIAIGGSLGKSKKDMFKILNWVIPLLNNQKPRHLLGIGSLEDIEKCIKMGIDTFDCVLPTRLARNGTFLVRDGKLVISNSKYKNDKNPIERNCQCLTCQNYSRAYLRHLFQAKEMLGPRLATIHNLYFMNKIFRQIRQKILFGKI
jgi:queuine tRNA-ribosyltransferase/7-cyano-7-deazaguanine tRNA-ribosyltransferase